MSRIYLTECGKFSKIEYQSL